MSKQFIKRIKKINRRRLNNFLLQKRVAKLERNLADEIELSRLDSEQTNDLLTELERKVEWLIKQNERLKQAGEPLQTQPKGLFAWLKAVLCSKGEP